MKQVIAMHGWYGDSSNWDTWADFFESYGWLWQSGERGYGNKTLFMPIWHEKKSQSSNECRALICHSLGSHLINENIFLDATHIVFICSFGRFIPLKGEGRHLKIALNEMYKRIGTKKERGMLTEFLKKSCYPDSISILDQEYRSKMLSIIGRKRLKADLSLLMNTNGIPNGLAKEARVLVINAKEDAIVTPLAKESLLQDLNDHLHQDASQWNLPNTGHTLCTPQLKKRVKEWLERSI